jgi:hypothetical protein
MCLDPSHAAPFLHALHVDFHPVDVPAGESGAGILERRRLDIALIRHQAGASVFVGVFLRPGAEAGCLRRDESHCSVHFRKSDFMHDFVGPVLPDQRRVGGVRFEVNAPPALLVKCTTDRADARIMRSHVDGAATRHVSNRSPEEDVLEVLCVRREGLRCHWDDHLGSKRSRPFGLKQHDDATARGVSRSACP